jgi:hypothetical protein
VVDLLGELDRALEVAERAHLVAATLRHQVGPAAARAHLRGQGFHDLVAPRELGVGAVTHLRAEQTLQEQIAIVGLGPRAPHRQHRAQPEPRRHRRDGAAAVGLQRAARDQRIGSLLQRLRHQELELAHLVARLEQAGQVVAVDVDLHPEPAGEAIELEDRGGRQGQLQPGWRCDHEAATRAPS